MKKLLNNKRTFAEPEGAPPLSPIASPEHPRHLTKRQEQNRAAQRAFRERRAQTLKEMETRLTHLERTVDDLGQSIRKIDTFETELLMMRNDLDNLKSSMESLSVPTWTVPSAEEMKPIYPTSNEPIGAILGALRPSSTDPTLSSNS